MDCRVPHDRDGRHLLRPDGGPPRRLLLVSAGAAVYPAPVRARIPGDRVSGAGSGELYSLSVVLKEPEWFSFIPRKASGRVFKMKSYPSSGFHPVLDFLTVFMYDQENATNTESCSSIML